jgi:ribose-phosphate pyrophosphokinase
MSVPLLFAMPGNTTMAEALASRAGAELGSLEMRRFPDAETYLRYVSDPKGREIALVCTLDRPDEKLIAVLFAAVTAREVGATRIGLIAPYLAYMRQDRRFNEGEAVTSRYVARLLSEAFDWLVTVDPHLHRYSSLADIYTIPAFVVHAAPLISEWIKARVENAIIIGPDSESEQWVSVVAEEAGVPFTVLEKTRRGDRSVEIRVKHPTRVEGKTLVFVDDIISSGRTMLEALMQIPGSTGDRPICMAVHGLFADDSDRLLTDAGATLVTSNTVPHATNDLDVSGLLASALAKAL